MSLESLYPAHPGRSRLSDLEGSTERAADLASAIRACSGPHPRVLPCLRAVEEPRDVVFSRRLGNSPRTVLEELARIQSHDVVLPTAPHCRIRLRCVTQPDPAQAALLYRLGIVLPKHIRLRSREVHRSHAAPDRRPPDQKCSANFLAKPYPIIVGVNSAQVARPRRNVPVSRFLSPPTAFSNAPRPKKSNFDWSYTIAPRSVSSKPLLPRLQSRKPSRCSRPLMWKLTADWLSPSATCAPRKPRCSTTERNTAKEVKSEFDTCMTLHQCF